MRPIHPPKTPDEIAKLAEVKQFGFKMKVVYHERLQLISKESGAVISDIIHEVLRWYFEFLDANPKAVFPYQNKNDSEPKNEKD